MNKILKQGALPGAPTIDDTIIIAPENAELVEICAGLKQTVVHLTKVVKDLQCQYEELQRRVSLKTEDMPTPDNQTVVTQQPDGEGFQLSSKNRKQLRRSGGKHGDKRKDHPTEYQQQNQRCSRIRPGQYMWASCIQPQHVTMLEHTWVTPTFLVLLLLQIKR